MFAVSAAYAAVHTVAAPSPKAGEYAMHFGGSHVPHAGNVLVVVGGPAYLVVAAGSAQMDDAGRRGRVDAGAARGFCGLRWRERRTRWFCLLWFLVTIAPLLPLRDHVTEYYVYLPVIGLCWLGGWALARIPSGRPGLRRLALRCLRFPEGSATLVRIRLELQPDGSHPEPGGRRGGRARTPPQAADPALRYGLRTVLQWRCATSLPAAGLRSVYLAPGTEKQT